MASSEPWITAPCNAASVLENVTPYKLCVYLFIHEYLSLRQTGSDRLIRSRKRNLFNNSSGLATPVPGFLFKPAFKKDCCMIVLQLIQSPDLDFKELLQVIHDKKYLVPFDLIRNFLMLLNIFKEADVGFFTDVISGRSNESSTEGGPIGIAGVFSKRIRLYFDKLSFDLVVEVYGNLKNYIRDVGDLNIPGSMDEPAWLASYVSQPDKSNIQPVDISPVPDATEGSVDMVDSVRIDLQRSEGPQNSTSPSSVMEIDMSAQSEPSQHLRVANSTVDGIRSAVNLENKELGGWKSLWSKQQVELFVMQQAKLIQEDQSKALPPPHLQRLIRQVLENNREHSVVHYLSYLNCVRSKEMNGALESLGHYFDRRQVNSKKSFRTNSADSANDSVVNLRLAALNLGILYTLFNKRKEAECAFNEAVCLAHESNDNVCLQYAQTWLYKLSEGNKENMIQKALSKGTELKMNYLLSFGYQACAQNSAFNHATPSSVFQVMSRSEALALEHLLVEVVGVSLAQRAALWSLYGRPGLASATAQLLLSLASLPTSGESAVAAETVVIAVSIIVQHFAIKGDYADAYRVLEFSKTLSPSNEWLSWSEAQLCFTESLHKGLWQQASSAINQLALVDKTEALLRECEMLLAMGERRGAHEAASKALKLAEGGLAQVRALRLIAHTDPSSAPQYLSSALHCAAENHLDLYRHLITLDILAIQVEMGLPAGNMCEGALVGALAHGSCADAADSLLLCGRGRVAAGDAAAALPLLDDAQRYAKCACDFARVKHIAFYQALICDTLGMTSHRNKYAYQYRTIDEQFPSYNASLLKL